MKNLSKYTINDLGFNIIRESLIDLAQCEENYGFFRHLMPTTDTVKLTEDNNFTNSIYETMIHKEDLDIPYLNNMDSTLSTLNIQGSILNEENFKKLYTLIQIDQTLKILFLKKSLKNWREIKIAHSDKKWLNKIEARFDLLSFEIKRNASTMLSKLYKKKDTIESDIQIKIKERFQYAKKKNWLQDDNISWVNERLALPIKVSYKNKINGIIHSHSSSSKTAFIEPIELVELNNIKTQNEFDIIKEKKKILSDLTSFFHPYKDLINTLYQVILKYDKHLTIAKYGISLNAIKPEFIKDFGIKIKGALNPILKGKVPKHIELDFEMAKNTNIIIISGPNTGGKTVVLKSLGLYALMAQSGLFLPAEYAELPIFENVLTDIGDKQSIETGLSTFSSHLINIKNIIKYSNKKSLILLDELGTGTDPNSSMAIAQSILEMLNAKNCKTIITTHLTNLKDWASHTDKIENAMMRFDYDNFMPTYEFQLGMPGSSYAIEILEKIGLPKKIINRARGLIGNKTAKLDKLIENIQKKEIEINSIKKKIETDLKKIEIEKDNYIDSNQKIEERKKQSEHYYALRGQEYIDSIKKEIEKSIEDIKLNQANKESIKNAKDIINKKMDRVKEKISINKKSAIKKVKKTDLILGEKFFIHSFNLIGIIDSKLFSDNKIYLKVDGKRIKIDYSDLSYLKEKQNKNKKYNKSNITLDITNLSSNKIDLRGFTVDEAINTLDHFIDSAYLNNFDNIHILHGTGTGALKEAIHSYLKLQKNVKTFNFATPENGGHGMTEVTLT